MIRSRLIVLILLWAYLGITPVGVYTCACLVPVQPALYQVDADETFEQTFPFNTAVTTLLNFFSLTFLMAVVFLLAERRFFQRRFAFICLEPYRFCEPPPTPPPHLA